MRFTSSLFGLVAIATSCFASPHLNYHNIINDLNSLHGIAVKLEGHINHFDVANMLQDKEDMVNGLDHLSMDAVAVKSVTSTEAVEVLSAANPLASEIIQLSEILIGRKNDIPAFLHGKIADDLQTFIHHAEGARVALINDCPMDKKQEAGKICDKIANALKNAANVFSH